MRDLATQPAIAHAAGEETGADPVPFLAPRIEGLSLEIDGRRLLDGIDLALAPGGLTVILGPNGAGKSLLVRLLHGMIRPSTGRVLWGGREIDDEIRHRQAMVFQRPVLLRRSVADNLDFVLSGNRRARAALRAGLLEKVGLADRARQPARLLSGGEQQRLVLARALAMKPEVLFLDEPTASLDPASVQMIETIVAEARDAGVRILFITHDMAQARRLADEVVFLHRGRVAEHAPADRFFDNPETEAAAAFLAGRILV
jgi:tungstate transport system ATP-binding protein